jgi:hypothetical protein
MFTNNISQILTFHNCKERFPMMAWLGCLYVDIYAIGQLPDADGPASDAHMTNCLRLRCSVP